MDKINAFNLGEHGVVNAKDPLHVIDGELTQAQNAVHNKPDEGLGGLEKRLGMAKLTTGALAGAVLGVVSVPLPDPSADAMRTFYWSDPSGGTDLDGKSWRRSTTNGVSWGAAEDIFEPPSPSMLDTTVPYIGSLGANGRYRHISCASLDGRLYYPGYNFPVYPTAGAAAPPLRVFDGVLDSELCRLPYNNKVGATSEAIACVGVYTLNNTLYVVSIDAFTSAANCRARVFALDGTSGALTQVGNAFGPDAGEATGGVPQVLAWHGGRLWAGTLGQADEANQTGLVYWIRPGVDTEWTLDHTTAVGQGHVTGMAEYDGDLYVGVSGQPGSAALILKRTPAGVWSTSKTGSKVTAGTTSTYWANLIVFEGDLYAAYFAADSGGILTEIHKFDGAAWSLDLDPDPLHILQRWPGMSVVRGDALYFAFSSTSWLVARKAAGAWTATILGGTGSGSSFLGFVE